MYDTDGRPLHVSWTYTRAEIIADGVVHGIGLVLGLIGAAVLIVGAAMRATAGETVAVTVYATCLLALLSTSAAYNLWPISPTKWWLRRFDHAAIFFLIAATYTPLVACLPLGPETVSLLIGVWTAAIAGAALKVALPGRFDRLSIALYLLLGFSGGLTWTSVAAGLAPTTVSLILAGGSVYAGGVVFHVWQSMRFQNAVWHGCVLVASALFYVAILGEVVLT